MYTTYPYGHDHGNSDTCGCLITPSGTRSKVLSSATAFGSLRNLANKRSGSDDTTYERDSDALRSGELVMEYQDSQYFIGDLALQQGRDASTGYGDIGRYASPRALMLLLATSAELVQSPEYGLEVVTGLPIESYSKDNRKAVKDALSGTHIFTLNGKRYRAHIHVQKVIMEGAGALIQYGNASNALQGVIDIGGRTTDLYAAHGQQAEVALCAGSPIGVESVGTRLNARMTNRFDCELSAHEIKQCLRASLGQDAYPPVNASGQSIDTDLLATWTQQSIEEVANDVASFVARTWNSSEQGHVARRISPVALVGGGAYYFHRVIRKRVEHAVMPLRPERANAEGYAALANVLAATQRVTA